MERRRQRSARSDQGRRRGPRCRTATRRVGAAAGNRLAGVLRPLLRDHQTVQREEAVWASASRFSNSAGAGGCGTQSKCGATSSTTPSIGSQGQQPDLGTRPSSPSCLTSCTAPGAVKSRMNPRLTFRRTRVLQHQALTSATALIDVMLDAERIEGWSRHRLGAGEPAIQRLAGRRGPHLPSEAQVHRCPTFIGPPDRIRGGGSRRRRDPGTIPGLVAGPVDRRHFGGPSLDFLGVVEVSNTESEAGRRVDLDNQRD